jgi:lipopolysaccharide export system protein LptC
MKNPKTLHSKKAVSSLLASLLLMVIAVAAIVSTYAWTTSITNRPQPTDVTPYKADLKFESDNKITLNIGNSGKADTSILAVRVGTSAADAAQLWTSPETPIALGAGAIANFTISYSWSAGRTYYFNITLANAQHSLIFQEQAPD